MYVFFYILYVYFVSPYFHHDAFMHHTMHARTWTPLTFIKFQFQLSFTQKTYLSNIRAMALINVVNRY